MTFTTLAFAQIWQALSVRSNRDALWQIGLFSNPILLLLAVLVAALQLAAIYTPALQRFLDTTTLLWSDLLLCLGAGFLVFVVTELEKAWLRRRTAAQPQPQREQSGIR